MRKQGILLTIVLLFFATTTFSQFSYPATKKTDHTDNYFGTRAAYPYGGTDGKKGF